MSIKLGMPYLPMSENLDQNAILAGRLGLAFIELHMSIPACFPENLDFERIKELGERYNLFFTVHLPEELDLGSHHKCIRLGSVKRVEQILEWSAKSGIRKVVSHIRRGTHFTMPDHKVFLNGMYQEDYMNYLVESFSAIDSCAQEHSMQICIENTRNFNLPFVQEPLRKILEFASVRLAWDIGHDMRSGWSDKEFIMEFADSVTHMHLHDCIGDSDHLAIGTGEIDYSHFLNFASQAAMTVLIEVKTEMALRESVGTLALA